MKRRIGSLILVLTVLLTLCAVAQADVLWEPDNNFYVKNADQCDYIGRQYYANGDEGFITLWEAPGGTRAVHQFQNGYTLWVYYQFEDWACAVVWGDEGEITGWAPMEDFVLKYDYLSFEEEYAMRRRSPFTSTPVRRSPKPFGRRRRSWTSLPAQRTAISLPLLPMRMAGPGGMWHTSLGHGTCGFAWMNRTAGTSRCVRWARRS